MKPTKIIGVGLNYRDLVSEIQEPIIFFKSISSIIGPGENICIPKDVNKAWAEVELAIIMGNKNQIKGYTVANDMTAENILGRDHHLARSKCLDTFCPINPQIKMLDVENLSMKTYINGEIKQNSSTSNMLYNCNDLIILISKYITLKENDIILTGTPGGWTQTTVRPGDVVTVSIENIGKLTNHIIGGK